MRNFWIRLSLSYLSCFATLAFATPAQYKTYEVDLRPLGRYPALAEELQTIKSRLKNAQDREPDLKRQLAIVSSLEEMEPSWLDARWIVAEKAFELGSFYTKESDLPFARSVFLNGSLAAQRCLKLQKDNPICKLLLGAMLGKMGAIDGVFSSIKQAKYVEQLWLDVLASPYDHRFTPSTTVQGAARYALGMFYRLVPDLALVRWLFDVQGDIEKSIRLHRETIAIDGPNTCNKVMLAVSLICAADGKADDQRAKEGLRHLQEAKELKPENSVAQVCWDSIPRLSTDLSTACGFETSRQQKRDGEIPAK